MEKTMEQTLRFGIEDYEKYFNPKDFLAGFLKDPESAADGNLLLFILQNVHKFWSSLGSNNLTMLEFGGGPSIYTLISACPFVREIVFAEFTEANRKEVEAWQKRESSSHDWSPFFKHVVQKLEGKSEKEAIKREEELRKKITRIIPCDICKTKPLHLNESRKDDQPKFDIVSTTACLEAAVKSEDAYCEAIAKLSKLLKPGGHLIMAGVVNSSFYMVGDEKFQDLPVTESLARRALDKAGFKNVHFVHSNQIEVEALEGTVSDYEGWWFAYGVL